MGLLTGEGRVPAFRYVPSGPDRVSIPEDNHRFFGTSSSSQSVEFVLVIGTGTSNPQSYRVMAVANRRPTKV